jgi:hypothetical protein
MNEALPPEPSSGVAGALEMLRHALADPLSAAGLKLELLERRLVSASPGEPALVERVRGARSDLGLAGRLIDLLPRLAAIAGEEPSAISLDELFRVAGVPLGADGEPHPHLFLRRVAASDALRILSGCFGAPEPAGASPRVRVEIAGGRVSLRIDGPGAFGANPERLFHLPRGEEPAAELFLARAAVESDGGTLELAEGDGLLSAYLSWPHRTAPADEGAAS